MLRLVQLSKITQRSGLVVCSKTCSTKLIRKFSDGKPENVSPTAALTQYCRDYTKAAKLGKLDPVIGRDVEIGQVIEILSRRSKNNPILVGEPGVGKTAIAEGLAERMVRNNVPDALKGRKLLSVDIGALVAGAVYNGELEGRLKEVLKEVQDAKGQIILFIDEIHTIMGAEHVGVSSILKPLLARGELLCIGATTLKEYKMHVDTDKALERRFQQVLVQQPNVEDTIHILRGLKKKYEVHHGVRITDSALVAAATLSHRYITERFLPDKAIDLLDVAAAKKKVQITHQPESIDDLERKIAQLQMERMSVADDDDASPRLAAIDSLLAPLQAQKQELCSQWVQEQAGALQLHEVKSQIDNIKMQMEMTNAERDSYHSVLWDLKYSTLLLMQQKLEEKQASTNNSEGTGGEKSVRNKVSEDDIAQMVSAWTGIPISKLHEGEVQKLLKLQDELDKRVVGQRRATQVVAEAIQRSRAGMSDPTKPIATLAFLGPTGVGKTELCKALASFLFDSDDAMVRIDMSEYMEQHAVSRLVGAPPGYIGFEEGGQLTEAVRRRPYSVVLFDEMEKAHPEVFNILLQLLDDGRLTDSKGNVVNFRNTIVIFTSNVGSSEISKLENKDSASSQAATMLALKQKFKPEFLNRIDEFVTFNSLDATQLVPIVSLELAKVNKRLGDRQLSLTATDGAKHWLAELDYDPSYGARPIKRTIQREVETPIAKGILGGQCPAKSTVLIDAQPGDDHLTIIVRKEGESSPSLWNRIVAAAGW